MKPKRRHLKESKGSNAWKIPQCIFSFYNCERHSGMIWTVAAILANKKL
jgi:hypothetical protein